jgi:5-methylcytosine-specific restriction endonuclease McrA
MIKRVCLGLPGQPCGRIIPGNLRRCPACQRAENARRHAKQEAHGRNTPEWLTLSRTRRALAGRCELQLDEGCTGRPETAHLNPARGGEHRGATLEDVRAACRQCHGVADAPRAEGRQP